MKYQFGRNNHEVKRIFQLIKDKWTKLVIFIVTLPLFIVLLQFILLYVIIPQNIPPDYVLFNFENPTISGMFFSNYIHSISDSGHLQGNYFSTLLCMGIIGVMIYIVMPAFEIRMSRKYIFWVFFCILFISPFIISATSLLFSKAFENINWSVGFSGITFALLGFGLFLVLWLIYEIYLRDENSKNLRKVEFSLVFINFCVCLVPLWILLSEIGGKTNVFAHMIGYSFGLMVPVIIGLIGKFDEIEGRDNQD